VLRFSYRNVSTAVASTSYGANFKVASVGGSIVSTALPYPEANGPFDVVIDGTAVALSPVMTATINLPADATGEVVLARITQGGSSCGAAIALPSGLIIDDLRAE
jgi:hypothetical protein